MKIREIKKAFKEAVKEGDVVISEIDDDGNEMPCILKTQYCLICGIPVN